MHPGWCRLFPLLEVLSMWFSIKAVTQAYDNIALFKSAYQRYPFEFENDVYGASNAVDGRKSDLGIDGGQCTVSATGKEIAIWRVDLGTIHFIDHITMYFMTNNQPWDERNNRLFSFLGFALYLSNTTDRLDGSMCFKDTQFNSSTIPEVFNTTCRMFGRYVIYYNERIDGVEYPVDYNQDAENDLCEVEVYGCPLENSDCDVWDPIMCGCLACKPSYNERELETTESHVGLYDYDTHDWCGHCLHPIHCMSGICLTGCSAGYLGSSCTEVCDKGHYGFNCNETCGHCDDPTQCSSVSGTCLSGCSDGYIGALCKDECDIGLFGYKCYDTCGHCMDPAECSHVSGTCLAGCAAGYFGRLCIDKCEIGLYGYNCNETCGHCIDSVQCSPVSGICLTGCVAGYSGRLCKEVDKERGTTTILYGFVAVLSILVITILVFICYIVQTRKNHASQQQNNETNPTLNETIITHLDRVVCRDYVELGEVTKNERPYMNMDTTGLV